MQPFFFDWAFNRLRGDAIRKHWDLIPGYTQVLVTHGPMGILDQARPGRSDFCGCCDLEMRIQKLDALKLHAFGHIHGGHGRKDVRGIVYVNGSICNEAYKPVNAPIVVDL